MSTTLQNFNKEKEVKDNLKLIRDCARRVEGGIHYSGRSFIQVKNDKGSLRMHLSENVTYKGIAEQIQVSFIHKNGEWWFSNGLSCSDIIGGNIILIRYNHMYSNIRGVMYLCKIKKGKKYHITGCDIISSC